MNRLHKAGLALALAALAFSPSAARAQAWGGGGTRLPPGPRTMPGSRGAALAAQLTPFSSRAPSTAMTFARPTATYTAPRMPSWSAAARPSVAPRAAATSTAPTTPRWNTAAARPTRAPRPTVTYRAPTTPRWNTAPTPRYNTAPTMPRWNATASRPAVAPRPTPSYSAPGFRPLNSHQLSQVRAMGRHVPGHYGTDRYGPGPYQDLYRLR